MFITLLLFVILLLGYLKYRHQYYSGPRTENFKNGQFHNNDTIRTKQPFIKTLNWFLFKKNHSSWTKLTKQDFDIPPQKVLENNLRISNIGHNSFLIQIAGVNILTDPIWSQRASPFSFVGPKRFVEPGIKFENLPKIDVVWISHNHYDHMDFKTITALWKNFHPRIITPLGNDTILKYHNNQIKCEAYDWYTETEITPKITFSFRPMQHWSSRWLLDRNKALWSALLIKTQWGDVLFIGDSGYGEGTLFNKDNYPNLRLAIIPMGAYKPEWLMEYSHMSPKDLLQVHKDLGMPYTIPSHYDVFNLGGENQFEAKDELEKLLRDNPENNIKILPVGQAVMVN